MKIVISGEVKNLEDSHAIMERFAEETGLTKGFPPSETVMPLCHKIAIGIPRRYLWTDAFAVCNFLGLFKATNAEHYRVRATTLIDQVHNLLGKHRADDPLGRKGWISGLSESEGAKHPTQNGLRIGKKLPERAQGDMDSYALKSINNIGRF